MLIIIILSIIWLGSFVISKTRKKSNGLFLRIWLLTLPFIIFLLLALAGKVKTLLPTMYFAIVLETQTLPVIKKQSHILKKYIPFLYLLSLSLLVGLIRFGLEWSVQNTSIAPTDSWNYWLMWTQDSGWDAHKTGTVFIKNLITGFIISGVLLAIYQYPNLKRKKRQLEETRLNEKLTQVELETLYAKINPEFLHHTLQTIADTALVNGETTREMSLRLSRYFRYCINKEERHLVIPAEEIEMTRIFLEFEQLHYPGKLEWSINMPKETDDKLIPRLLLQSLSDYCIRQATNKPIDHLFLQIEFLSLANGLVLQIHPQGLLLTEHDLHSTAFRRISQKLDLILSDSYALNIHPEPANEIIVLLKKYRYI